MLDTPTVFQQQARSCLGQATPLSTPEQGELITTLIEGLYRSAASGDLVRFD